MKYIYILIALFSCNKPKEEVEKTYSVTYTFYSDAPSYYVRIWDVTQLNDFEDSIKVSPFTKTITYNYEATHRCKIDNGKIKKIEIIHDGLVNTCQDTLYPSLNCYIGL